MWLWIDHSSLGFNDRHDEAEAMPGLLGCKTVACVLDEAVLDRRQCCMDVGAGPWAHSCCSALAGGHDIS